MSNKIRRVSSTEGMASRDTVEKMDGIAHRILEICTTELGESFSVIYKNVKSSKANQDSVKTIVAGLVENGYLVESDSGKKYRGEVVYRYKSTGKSDE